MDLTYKDRHDKERTIRDIWAWDPYGKGNYVEAPNQSVIQSVYEEYSKGRATAEGMREILEKRPLAEVLSKSLERMCEKYPDAVSCPVKEKEEEPKESSIGVTLGVSYLTNFEDSQALQFNGGIENLIGPVGVDFSIRQSQIRDKSNKVSESQGNYTFAQEQESKGINATGYLVGLNLNLGNLGVGARIGKNEWEWNDSFEESLSKDGGVLDSSTFTVEHNKTSSVRQVVGTYKFDNGINLHLLLDRDTFDKFHDKGIYNLGLGISAQFGGK